MEQKTMLNNLLDLFQELETEKAQNRLLTIKLELKNVASTPALVVGAVHNADSETKLLQYAKNQLTAKCISSYYGVSGSLNSDNTINVTTTLERFTDSVLSNDTKVFTTGELEVLLAGHIKKIYNEKINEKLLKLLEEKALKEATPVEED